jgi:hypothetical protein
VRTGTSGIATCTVSSPRCRHPPRNKPVYATLAWSSADGACRRGRYRVADLCDVSLAVSSQLWQLQP